MSQSVAASPFQPLITKRASERVADAITQTIVDGTFSPGELLPPERDLAQRFRVTRNTVREALRSLEQLRLIAIRQGSGVTVQDYAATAGVEFLAALLSTDALGSELMKQLWEARAVLGRAMFEHAVDRFDCREMAALAIAVSDFTAEAAKEHADPRRLQALEFAVHGALLRGAGNQAFVFLHNSLRHTIEPVAHLFSAVVGQPERLAAEYRRGLSALEHGDRLAAKVAFCASLGVVAQPPETPQSKKAGAKRRRRKARRR